MKFRVTLKDPDGFSEGVDDALDGSIRLTGLDEDEQEALKQHREEKLWAVLNGWVDCREYVTLEFDTDAGTAIVVKR